MSSTIRKMVTGTLVTLLSVSLMIPQTSASNKENSVPEIESKVKDTLKIKGKRFKDLNETTCLQEFREQVA